MKPVLKNVVSIRAIASPWAALFLFACNVSVGVTRRLRWKKIYGRGEASCVMAGVNYTLNWMCVVVALPSLMVFTAALTAVNCFQL